MNEILEFNFHKLKKTKTHTLTILAQRRDSTSSLFKSTQNFPSFSLTKQRMKDGEEKE